ncbi:hypothetical protein [Brevundimonas sp. NIBR11]|uniref:hypothetical protein n=1 Tax=Brevundimonas sp. NIBR11 TaxID=3015999 RepID=UPI0022EFE0CA|nr:hypothetical protein [Brevundimonas sp. NIBR11]WGM30021.1 hypothetical protein KKHFBJBL_00236 [Brevundimonas sp. NIBR11]
MFWTGLIVAALVVGQTTPATPQTAPTSDVAPVTVEGARLESGANTRASDPQQEVICRDQPVTGSRFNRRRCRTRQQANIQAAEARSAVAAMQGSGPSTDAALGGLRPIGP